MEKTQKIIDLIVKDGNINTSFANILSDLLKGATNGRN